MLLNGLIGTTLKRWIQLLWIDAFMMDVIASTDSTIHSFNSKVGIYSSSQNLLADLMIMASTVVTSTLFNYFKGITSK